MTNESIDKIVALGVEIRKQQEAVAAIERNLADAQQRLASTIERLKRHLETSR